MEVVEEDGESDYEKESEELNDDQLCVKEKINEESFFSIDNDCDRDTANRIGQYEDGIEQDGEMTNKNQDMISQDGDRIRKDKENV